ncbi:hypothetical protein CR105_05750 [Massilia eurypsychrophila]|uniref:DUF3592 domain-containing protein n=2 Tax=Massilia eurypsychrophila TaxID=1485217 RepID=A0A2G8THU6_9BURK|nr:hypothetical protein CR105_05750 [Massilia eurypsychrophila]
MVRRAQGSECRAANCWEATTSASLENSGKSQYCPIYEPICQPCDRQPGRMEADATARSVIVPGKTTTPRGPIPVGKMSNYVPPPDPQGNKILGWLFILSAILIAVFTSTRVYDKVASRSWPTTYGKIFSSAMYHTSGRSSLWCVKLRYRYVIDGKTFFSTRVSTTRMAGPPACDRDKEVITARMERYRPGALLKIRYHPTNPETATVYIDELDMMDYLFSLISVFLLFGGIKAIRDAAKMRSPVDILLNRG